MERLSPPEKQQFDPHGPSRASNSPNGHAAELQPPTMTRKQRAAIIDLLVSDEIRKVSDRGELITDLNAFKGHIRAQIAEHERHTPDFLQRALDRLTRPADSKRITRCREVRGLLFGMTHLYDPHGTDNPPPWWNEDEAKAIWIETERAKRNSTP